MNILWTPRGENKKSKWNTLGFNPQHENIIL